MSRQQIKEGVIKNTIAVAAWVKSLFNIYSAPADYESKIIKLLNYRRSVLIKKVSHCEEIIKVCKGTIEDIDHFINEFEKA